MIEQEPFDAKTAVRELARLAPRKAGRKLTFVRRCGAYAALFNGVSTALVAEEFKLSKTSVSNLAGCRDDLRIGTTMTVGDYSETFPDPSLTVRRHPDRKSRYQDVAAEFNRLGADAFLARYFTAELHAALISRVVKPGPDPNANEFAGFFHRPDINERFLIAWRDECWRFIPALEDKTPMPNCQWSDPFKTSNDARAYLLTIA